MDWITEEIAIGNFEEAEDITLLREGAIRSVLSLDGTLQGKEAGPLGLKDIEVVLLKDAEGNDVRLFLWAVDALVRLVRDSPRVLVQCRAGRSRSPVVVAGYLMKTLGIDSDEALARVSAKREINITRGVERLLDFIE